MRAGLVVFVLGRSALRGAGEAAKALAKPTEWTLYAVGLAGVAVIWGLIQFQDVIQTLLVYSGTLLLGYVAMEATFKMPYGSFASAPQGRVRTMIAGILLMLVQPIATTFGLTIATEPLAAGMQG